MSSSPAVVLRPIDRFGIRVSAVLWFVLGIGFLLSVPVIVGWTAWAMAAIVAVAIVAALPMAWLMRRVFRWARERSFIRIWVKAGFAALFVLGILVAAPVYYLLVTTESDPVVVPTVVMSNGKKTLVFQGMQHVGIERFYKAVVHDLENALGDGFVLYYEGVNKSTPDADQWFAQTRADGKDFGAGYRELGQICGLHYQNDYFTLLAADMQARPALHVTADVDTADLKREYDRLLAVDPTFAASMRSRDAAVARVNQAGARRIAAFVSWQKKGTEEQKALADIVCRGVMTVVMRRAMNDSSDPLTPVVLEFRNRELVRRIVEESRDKIYVTYGAAHVPGVIALLQQRDAGWKVQSVKWMRPIEAPERSQGAL